jgi:F-type H+-transporting ATPase subunit beta
MPLTIKRKNGKELIIEVQQHIGEDTIRAVAMDSTDGLQRGMEVVNTEAPIEMPYGAQIRGRVMNVVGDTIDGLDPLDREKDCLYIVNRQNSKTSRLPRKY